MKKTMRFMLIAALTVGLSFAATSCKDDDKNDGGGSSQTAEEQAAEHAETFWAVAANLVSPFDVTTEYENKTFEPTIGSPLNGNSTIRVVSTGNMSAAAKRFADLTGAPVDENTTTYTYEDDAVGTLVYTKTNDATSLAKVDVSIKQIPHLQQIVYMTPEQMGTNGTFKGNSYYSFGDVILRYNKDDQPEYWVCVRPALGPAGKEDTHWMTVSKLPDDNIRLLEENRKVVAAVPTQLGKNEEHMQNLAEMLYAMFNPEQWQENIEQNSSYGLLGAKGLPIFHDMKPVRVQYFNKYFWTLLEKDWEKNELFQMIFGYSAEQMKGYVNSADGLFLLGKGYTGTAGLYQWQFKNGDGSKSNQHDMKYSVVKKTGIALENAKLYYDNQYKNNHWVNEAFFGDNNPRFVIRIATGKQLAGQDPGPRFSLATSSNKIADTFVFNKVHNVTISPNIDPKVYTEQDVNGGGEGYEHGLYQPGDVLQDEMGDKWMCIFGAACDNVFGFRDRTAWFVSFDRIQHDNIVKEKDLMEMAHRFTFGVYHSMTDREDSYGFKGADRRGQWQTAYDYAGIDMSKLWVHRDTTWTFTADGRTYNSVADKNLMTNIVYVGDDGKLKLLRCIADNSQGGSERTAAKGPSGKAYDTPKMRFYKHYETFDPSQMEPLNDDEKALSMTMWLKPWVITNDEMHFEDLSNQSKVDKYAANDKWVTLPLHGTTERQKPKTNANNSVYGRGQYEYDTKTKDFYTPGLTGIFKEPVLIMRLMKVTDNGGTTPNLTAQDGTKLTVVKLVENRYLYDNNLVPMINYMLRNNYQQSLIFLDNQPYQSDYKF